MPTHPELLGAPDFMNAVQLPLPEPDQTPQVKTVIDDLVTNGLSSTDPITFNRALEDLLELGQLAPQFGHRIPEAQRSTAELPQYSLSKTHECLDILLHQLEKPALNKETKKSQELCWQLLGLLTTKRFPRRLDPYSLATENKIGEQLRQTIIEGVLRGKTEFDQGLLIYLRHYPLSFDLVRSEVGVVQNKILPDQFKPNLKAFFTSDSQQVQSQGFFLAEKLLEKIGLNANEACQLLFFWMSNLEPRKGTNSEIWDHLETMFELERQIPGITRWLSTAYGIKCFGRYPREFLLDQYAHRFDTKNPWGVIIYPHADHNGTFHRGFNGKFHQGLDLLRSLQNSLKELTQENGTNYQLRIVESSNLLSLSKILLRLRKTYGRISFAIVGGHGDGSKIFFGGGDRESEILTAGQLRSGDGLLRGVQKLFKPGAPIALFVCSAGISDGLARALSGLGFSVTGPDRNRAAVRVALRQSGGKLALDVKYYGDDCRARLYSRGVEKTVAPPEIVS